MAVFVLNLKTMRLLGELPQPKDGFRISEASGPWWQSPRHIRVLGERATEDGLETSIYEADINGGDWRKVYTLKNAPGACSFAFSLPQGVLRGSVDGTQDLIIADSDGRTASGSPRSCALQAPALPFANDIQWMPDGWPVDQRRQPDAAPPASQARADRRLEG